MDRPGGNGKFKRDPPLKVCIGALLAIGALIVHVTLAHRFDRFGLLEAHNVVFDADSDTRLRTMTDGLHLGVKHPNFAAYVHPPIAATARLLTATGLTAESAGHARRTLAIYAVPVASAIKAAVVFWLFLLLGYSTAQSAAATALGIGSFSNLIFGSIPETYGFSSLVVALAFVLGARRPAPRIRALLWIVVGVGAMGITVVNVALVGLVLLVSELMAGPWRLALRRAAALLAGIVAVTVLTSYAFDRVLPRLAGSRVEAPASPQERRAGRLPPSGIDLVERYERYIALGVLPRVRRFPGIIVNTLAPRSVDTWQATSTSPQPFAFTLETQPPMRRFGDPLGLAVAILLPLGAYGALRARSPSRGLAIASAAVFAFCAAVSFWGPELYLYSQNWHLATLVLVAGIMRTGRFERAGVAVVALLAIAIAVNNYAILQNMFALLR